MDRHVLEPSAPPGAAAPDIARVTFRRIQRHMSPGIALSGKFAGQGAVEESASGCEVLLSDGRSVLDFGSYAVTLLGHRNPAVVDAVRRQLDVMPTSTRSLASPVSALAAERVSEYLGGGLNRVYFGINGADAVEAAVKLARLATGRRVVVAVEGGYHGKSLGALGLTHHDRFRDGLTGLLGGVVHVAPDDPEAVARVTAETDVAAVVFEPVQGENGVRPLETEVLRRWSADARRAGAFTVSDEIQCGLRRCGDPSVALAAGIEVDAVLLGKPLGGGVVPVSALVCSDALYEPLLKDPFRHTATFGGHPLATAAVPAALAEIEAAADNGAELARLMEQGLRTLREDNPGLVADVRGRGLLWGVDFAGTELAGEVQMGLARRGLLVSPCLSRPRTLRLLPPLVAGPAEVGRAMAVLDDALKEAGAAWGGRG
ncbi:aspartate aminotransferase family protein [Streptosporangium sp. NPDC020072]|uniref:aspartate aminotransferase family protein n=1 Tax=Streptosporangium sp. NPDC020072 TaxID=3154788 RepID=UPI00342F7AE8